MKKLIYLLMAALGFVACEEEKMLMYGPMVSVYEIKTRVVDEAGTPIYGIEASTGKNGEFTPVGYTDQSGTFSLSLEEHADAQVIKFTDVDGEANGGEFESKSINIRQEIINGDIVMGTAIVDVTLKKRE